jgi:hypothetical protein
LVGVTIFAILAVILWNPLVQRLGDKTSLTHAQELLKLTREQYNALTPEERDRLAESVQGNLDQIWQEAEQAKDLQFLQGNELERISEIDVNRALGFQESSSTKKALEELKKSNSLPTIKESSFRYTDSQGKITYINLSTFETLPEGLLLSSKTNIEVLKLSATAPDKNVEERVKEATDPVKLKELGEKAKLLSKQVTPELKQHVQQIIEKKLQKSYPEILAKWNTAHDREITMFSLFDHDEVMKDLSRSQNFIPKDKLETVRNNTQATILNLDANQQVDFTTLYIVNVYFIDEQGKHYLITDSFDSSKPDDLEVQLFIRREK